MFSQRHRIPFIVLILFALFFATAPTGLVLAGGPLSPQTYYSQHAFWAHPSTHPFLFAKSGAPCYGKSSCYIDSYLWYYAPWSGTWVYGVDYGNQFINLLPDGTTLTNWARGNHNSLARWAQNPCVGHASDCRFTARRDYVNTSGKQREEVFAYGRFWLFDLTVPDGNRVLDTGPICKSSVNGQKTNGASYQERYVSGNDPSLVRVELPSNIVCQEISIFLAPGGGRSRP